MKNIILQLSKSMVVSDFDGTVTKKVVNGQKVPSLVSVLVTPENLGKDGVEAYQQLFNRYYPLEQDQEISSEQKCKLMQEWWEKVYTLFATSRVTKQMVLDACNSPLIQIRENVADFYRFLFNHHVPLILYSSNGFGVEAINLVLANYHIHFSNIKVVSNHLMFDQHGVFNHVELPIIHSANKTGDTLIKYKLIAQKPERSQCLLIGDSINDVDMIKGIDFEETIKVAFGDRNLAELNQKFDLVLPIEGGYQPIQKLFRV